MSAFEDGEVGEAALFEGVFTEWKAAAVEGLMAQQLLPLRPSLLLNPLVHTQKVNRSIAVRRGAGLKLKIPAPSPPRAPPPQPLVPEPAKKELGSKKLKKVLATQKLVKESGEQVSKLSGNMRRFGPQFFSWWMLQSGDDDVFE
ncbi:hypothetical protein Esti_002959 [Eimeria stiedai]